ncbi:MAG: hypothetical protein QF807_05655 [Candidatus Thalassarchaeaceae archaeon]|nr:hypothetical protein [Candidatus Thalassarchaeaceae archaeon]
MQGTPAPPPNANTVVTQESVVEDNIERGTDTQLLGQGDLKLHQWINFGLVCLALVMVSVSIFSDSWVVQEQELFGSTLESKTGLDDTTTISCDGDGDCETEESDISEDYDDCKKDMDEWENSEFDLGEYPFKEMCESVGDSAKAGLIGTIAFWFSVVLLLASGVLLLLGALGKKIPFANNSPVIPGVVIFLGFALWRLLLPSMNGDYGWAAKLTLFSGVLACYVGTNPLLDKIHAPNGLASFFSDDKLEMLRKLNLVWFGLTILGLMLLFFIPIIGLPIMLLGLLFSFINFSDPKLFSEQTEHGEQRMLLLQFGRNHGKPVEEVPSPSPTVPTLPEPPAPVPPAPAPPAPTPPAPAPPEATLPEPEPEPPEPETQSPTPQETVEDVDWPEVAPEPETPNKQEEVVDEPAPEVPIVQEEVESENDDDSSKLEPAAPAPEPMIPPAPAPPTNPLPPAPSPVPQAVPPPMAPMPSPPQTSAPTNLPPPPVTPMPPPMAQMPPPPMAQVPPPPSAGLPPPLPLPPQGKNMGQNPFITQRPKEPRSYSVQAAPRDELMSSEEADDLLQDLNE